MSACVIVFKVCRQALTSQRVEFILTTFLISLMMACIVSGVSTLVGKGLPAKLLGFWMTAWSSSWLIAFPMLLFVLSLAHKMGRE